MSIACMNDPVWLAGLSRARATQKYEFECIHVLAPLREKNGVAPVVLQTSTGYLRSPTFIEPALELCLRHLHKAEAPKPKNCYMTTQALLADRAKAALQLPGRYIPMADGTVIDATPGHNEATPTALDATEGSPRQSESIERLPASPRTPGNAETSMESPRLSDDAARPLELPQLPDYTVLPDAGSSESPRLPDTGDPLGTSHSAPEALAGTAALLSKRARRRAFIKARKRHKGQA